MCRCLFSTALSQSRIHVCCVLCVITHTHTHTHTRARLTALFLGIPRWAGTRRVKPIWILLKQETVSGNGISWAICKSAPRSRQITAPASHHSLFYRPDALPAAQPTASKHWRHCAFYNKWNENPFGRQRRHKKRLILHAVHRHGLLLYT